MEYSHKVESGVLVLSLKGDLIGELKGPELLEIINNTLGENIRYCAIDISEVRYINSSGIGVLITILTKFRNKDGEVCLVNPSDHVKKLLIITKLNAIFNVEDDLNDAIKKLQSEG